MKEIILIIIIIAQNHKRIRELKTGHHPRNVLGALGAHAGDRRCTVGAEEVKKD